MVDLAFRSSRRCAALLALVLCSIGGSAARLGAQRASSSTRIIRFIVDGGVTVPRGDLKTFHDAVGMHAAASLLLQLPGLPISIRPELSLTRFKQNPVTVNTLALPNNVAPVAQGGTTQMLGALGNIEVPLAAGLYLLGGVGVLNLDAASESQAQLTVNAGAGIRFKLSAIEGYIEGRFGTASYSPGKFGYKDAAFIPISFGVVF